MGPKDVLGKIDKMDSLCRDGKIEVKSLVRSIYESLGKEIPADKDDTHEPKAGDLYMYGGEVCILTPNGKNVRFVPWGGGEPVALLNGGLTHKAIHQKGQVICDAKQVHDALMGLVQSKRTPYEPVGTPDGSVDPFTGPFISYRP